MIASIAVVGSIALALVNVSDRARRKQPTTETERGGAHVRW